MGDDEPLKLRAGVTVDFHPMDVQTPEVLETMRHQLEVKAAKKDGRAYRGAEVAYLLAHGNRKDWKRISGLTLGSNVCKSLLAIVWDSVSRVSKA